MVSESDQIIIHLNKLIIIIILYTDEHHNWQGSPKPLTEADINRYADENRSIIFGSSAHTLLLSKGGDVGEIDNATVCKGM